MVLLVDQVEGLNDRHIAGEILLAHVHRGLDHVLRAGDDRVRVLENRAEPLEDRVQSLWKGLRKHLARFFEQRDRQLDRGVRRLVHQKDEDLEDDDLVGHSLVDQTGEELAHRDAERLVARGESVLELDDEPLEDLLADVWKFRLDDRNEGRAKM